MKKLHNIIAVCAMLFLITALLITSFQIAIYGDASYSFYEKEYMKYGVDEELQMDMPAIMDVTEQMMSYLIGEKEELSVVTLVNGKEQDFFNEQDRLHMADVKQLFLSGLDLRLWLMAAFVLLILLFLIFKGDWKQMIPKAYITGLGIFGVLTIILGILFASDFTKYFTIFHEIFFTNDLWIFDPAEDLMIRMLPEGFFYDMVMRIGAVFIGGLLLLLIVSIVWKRIVKKQETVKIC